ncbi:hypothetical protein [Trinickia acidisoli]|uniref:hypothetical protein n=1 Tax=Trinickia acidisoli TaxID=2767482 RepID=UPI001A8E5EC6|nr:hypothetical protein [Trinickia acidisoli]
MSVPESSTSKGRPSLLSETAPGAPDSSSRILASLEGRIVAQQALRRRSKKPWAAVALAIVGFGAFGAWQWQRSQGSVHPIAAVAAGAGKAQGAAGASGAAAAAVNASGAAGSMRATQVGQGAASAPQTAVIVADASASGVSSPGASSPNETDADRLSRALTDGVSPAQGVVAQAVGKAASAATTSGEKRATSKAIAARDERESARSRHEKWAAAHAGKHAKGSSVRDDPDADLLAALVARTKPYDARAPKDGDAAAKGAIAKARPISIAERIKQCDKSNFFEAQICRWRVCSDHWGKDPACPSTGSPSPAPAH